MVPPCGHFKDKLLLFLCVILCNVGQRAQCMYVADAHQCQHQIKCFLEHHTVLSHFLNVGISRINVAQRKIHKLKLCRKKEECTFNFICFA